MYFVDLLLSVLATLDRSVVGVPRPVLVYSVYLLWSPCGKNWTVGDLECTLVSWFSVMTLGSSMRWHVAPSSCWESRASPQKGRRSEGPGSQEDLRGPWTGACEPKLSGETPQLREASSPGSGE